jgi:hypothetical protein
LPIFFRLSAQKPDHLLLLRQTAKRRNLEVSRHLGQFLGRLCLELGNGDMGRTRPGRDWLRGVWRSVPLPRLAISGLPAVSAVSAVTSKALGAVGPFARRRSRAPVTPSPIVSSASAIVELGSAIARWFSGTIDRRRFPHRGGCSRRPRCRVCHVNLVNRGRIHGTHCIRFGVYSGLRFNVYNGFPAGF